MNILIYKNFSSIVGFCIACLVNKVKNHMLFWNGDYLKKGLSYWGMRSLFVTIVVSWSGMSVAEGNWVFISIEWLCT